MYSETILESMIKMYNEEVDETECDIDALDLKGLEDTLVNGTDFELDMDVGYKLESVNVYTIDDKYFIEHMDLLKVLESIPVNESVISDDSEYAIFRKICEANGVAADDTYLLMEDTNIYKSQIYALKARIKTAKNPVEKEKLKKKLVDIEYKLKRTMSDKRIKKARKKSKGRSKKK